MGDFEIALSKKIEVPWHREFLTEAYPWIVWILGAVFFFYKYLLQVSPNVISADLMRAYSISGAGLGNLAACFFYTYLIMQIPVGILLDRWSPRWVIAAAIFICSLGTLLFSKADTLWFAGLSRALIGFGAAFAAVSCFKLASIWFPPKRFALVAGLSMTAAMLGGVSGEAPLSFLVNAWGWREAMFFMAFPGFLLTLLIIFFVRDGQRKNVKKYHTTQTSVNFRALWKQLIIIVKSGQTWILSFYSGLAFSPVTILGGLWGVSFLEQSYHITDITAAMATSFIFIGFAIGCPISGWLSDFIQRRKVIMAVGTAIALVSIIFIIYIPVNSLALLKCLMLFFGLGSSCFFICFSVIREIYPLIFAATVLGFMNTFDSVCEAVSEPLVGKLLDMGWNGTLDNGARIFSASNYHAALLILPLYIFSALVLLFFIKETFCVQKDL